MTEITPNEEFIKRNYDKTIDLIKKVYHLQEGDVSPLLGMIETFGERYALAPASSHRDYFSAFPGGLCYHNLHVLTWIGRFVNIMAPKEFSAETLLKVSLLNQIGKIGDISNDMYVPVKEDWKMKNGTFFDINNEISYMRIPQRSLFLVSHFGIPLTEEEHLAILLSEGQYDNANSSYKYREPKLALVLQNAIRWAQHIEKDNIIKWP